MPVTAPSQVRQGDVFLRKTTNLADDLKPVKAVKGMLILAHGELTGHAHVVRAEDAQLLRSGRKTVLKVGPEGADLSHEEHGTIRLPAGTFEVILQREFDPDAPPETPRRVAD